MTLVLDTGILGRLCHPHVRQHQPFTQWLAGTLAQTPRESIVVIPEIADYELRRKLLHLAKRNPSARQSIQRLDRLTQMLEYRALTTATMRRAAALWAEARQQGWPTAAPDALDGDVILAAQTLEVEGAVLTTNPAHLSRFVPVKDWKDLAPSSSR